MCVVAEVNRIINQFITIFGQLGVAAKALIIGLSLLVGIITAIYFLKKDRSGSEEGKAGLTRVGTAILVAAGASFMFNALSVYFMSVFN